MAEIIRENKDSQNILCKITIEPEDYTAQLTKELKKYQRDGNFKGFRKGKAPMGFVKKMYGKSALANQVNQILQEKLMAIMEEEQDRLLGQPIPAETQELVDFDPENPATYEFKFDLGLAPVIEEIAGLTPESTFDYPTVVVSDEMVNQEMDAIRLRDGEGSDVENATDENDILLIEATELDGDTPKTDGWETSFSVMVKDLVPEKRAEVMGKTLGDTFNFDIYALEEGMNESLVRKHLLRLEDDPEKAATIGNMFQGTIRKISRRTPAEINEAFLEKNFPEEAAKTEEDARAFLKKNIEDYYNKQAETFLWKMFRDHIMKQNPVELPHDFLKRWLLYSNEDLSKDVLDSEYDAFAENTRWSLLRRKMLEDFNISVSDDDINAAIQKNVAQRFGNSLDPATMAMIINRYRENQDQIEDLRQDLISDKLFENLKEQFTLKPYPVSEKEFGEKVKELNESFLKQSLKEEVEAAKLEEEE